MRLKVKRRQFKLRKRRAKLRKRRAKLRKRRLNEAEGMQKKVQAEKDEPKLRKGN